LFSSKWIWHATFKSTVNPGPSFKLGEVRMETLTDDQMVEIEGGDGFGSALGLAALLICLCL